MVAKVSIQTLNVGEIYELLSAKRRSKFAGSDIGVQVVGLTVLAAGNGCDHWDVSLRLKSLDEPDIDFGDTTYETEALVLWLSNKEIGVQP